MVELKCETDFVAKSEQFNAVANELAQAVLAGGPDAASQRSGDLDELKISLKENIELGRVVQFVKRPTGASSTATCTCRASEA